MAEKAEGWLSSDGKLFKTEQEAISHENFNEVRNNLLKVVNSDPWMHASQEYVVACYFVAEHRRKIFDLIKDRLD